MNVFPVALLKWRMGRRAGIEVVVKGEIPIPALKLASTVFALGQNVRLLCMSCLKEESINFNCRTSLFIRHSQLLNLEPRCFKVLRLRSRVSFLFLTLQSIAKR